MLPDIPDVDLSKYGNFSVEVVDAVSDYLDLSYVRPPESLCSLFCFRCRRLTFDAMRAVLRITANGVILLNGMFMHDSICNGVRLQDFGHGHPDPNIIGNHCRRSLQFADGCYYTDHVS
ncbi:phosphoglucomutase, chloroplastic-like [Rutidosis leptorrhynchoides]|uniref:phosphoglucomutase, chloroplastic-like n=1 Tax=Rutidosis leptorrhynchoides TaxID=125765 RepID=UPI003A99B800